ncbi:hypothetical protein BGX29_005933 [Mortierella sp. GBA35]|nr:hypothetical protein BGX29_005933 [Mortierella sp. GBA35]
MPNNNPFDLPELQHRLSRFVSLQDALSCARVSKSWSDIFISVIWFMIDFETQPRFAELPFETISKYGHHIRIVENVHSCAEMKSLANPQVRRLRKLKYMDTTQSNLEHIWGYEIVARNSSSLLRLDLVPEEPIPFEHHNRLSNYVPVTALLPSFGASQPSKLYRLCMMDLHLTYDGLMTILRGCPHLTKLGLVNVALLGRPGGHQPYQHEGIVFFSCHHRAFFRTDPLDGLPAPSLLTHFPNLKTIELCENEGDVSVPPNLIMDQLSKQCPSLTGLRVQGLTDCSPLVSQFCSSVNRNVSELAFDYDHLSLGIITSLLLHPTSLRSIKIYRSQDLVFNREYVPPVSDHFQHSGQFLQLIPRTCSQLRIMDFHLHEMDMDVVEMGEWKCKALRRLRIRVKGLDTKKKILGAIALWRAGWRAQRLTKPSTDSGVSVLDVQLSSATIEARVARHLLKLTNLETVWLGCQDWTPF